MRKYFLLWLIVMIQVSGFAQTDAKNIMVLLQECLNLNSNNQQDQIRLYENTGIIEYKQANILQRVTLAELQKIEVKSNNAGFSVDIKCGGENICINFIKNDTASSSFAATAIQFSDMALANTFAENLSTLIMQYKTAGPPLEKILVKNDQGRTPLLGVKTAPEKKGPPAGTSTTAKAPPEQTEADDDPEPPQPPAKPTTKPAKLTAEEREDLKAEKQEERLAAKEKAATEKEEKENARKASRIKKKTEKDESEADESEEQKTTEKTTTRKQRRDQREAEPDNGENENENTNPTKKSRSNSGNKLIEDVGDDNTGDEKTKSKNDFCAQLISILQSGKENKFQSIEGKLTNAESKINDSKVRLKGSKKNYLSWFKKERAFISEIKSGNDYELMLKDFENFQTQLDECLGAGWDMEDKSGSEEYAKLKTEVKDVEFKKDNDETMPAIRVIFIEDKEKFTMFMRIK